MHTYFSPTSILIPKNQTRKKMLKSTLSPPNFLLLLLIFSFNIGGILQFSHGLEKTWCVPKPSTSDEQLLANINFACAEIGAMGENCSFIQAGGSCFYPNTLINHASVSMNFYYHLVGSNGWNCDFKGSGLITSTDPSYERCQYI